MDTPASQDRQWDRQDLPSGAEKVVAVRQMFDAIAPRYDFVNRLITFRLDVRWRKKTVLALKLQPGAKVIDLASGTGDFCIELKRSGYDPVSIDLSFGMLSADRSNSPRIQADILKLPLPNKSVDGVTCGFALRNLVSLELFFTELARVTKHGGRIALLDVSIPSNPLVRIGHRIYFGKIVPLIGGLISDRAAYNYLPRSVAYLPNSNKLVELLSSCGFSDASNQQLSGGLTQLLVATKD